MSGDHNMHQKPKSYLDSSGIMDRLKEDDARTWASIAIVIERRKVAQWMMDRGYATGHGDTVEDLLKELDWQIRESEREACAKVVEAIERNGAWVTKEEAAAAIRARGNT